MDYIVLSINFIRTQRSSELITRIYIFWKSSGSDSNSNSEARAELTFSREGSWSCKRVKISKGPIFYEIRNWISWFWILKKSICFCVLQKCYKAFCMRLLEVGRGVRGGVVNYQKNYLKTIINFEYFWKFLFWVLFFDRKEFRWKTWNIRPISWEIYSFFVETFISNKRCRWPR